MKNNLPDGNTEREGSRFVFLLITYFKRCGTLLAPAWFLSLSLLFFPGVETYLGNFADYEIPLGAFIGPLLAFSAGIGLALALLEGFLPSRGVPFAAASDFAVGFLFYLQSDFLNGEMVSLTGEVEAYSDDTVGENLFVWGIVLLLIVIAIVIAVRHEWEKKITVGALGLSLLLLFMQGSGIVGKAFQTSGERETVTYEDRLTNRGEMELSRENNVVVFILDTATDSYVQRARSRYPHLFDRLDGFTYYTDCLPEYTRTYPAIPYLLTNVPCYFDTPESDFIDMAYETGTFLPELASSGVKIGLYTETRLSEKRRTTGLRTSRAGERFPIRRPPCSRKAFRSP